MKGGSGKVVESTHYDHIFVYFTDHGGVGLVSFPDSVVSLLINFLQHFDKPSFLSAYNVNIKSLLFQLTVKDLNDELKRMHKLKKFERLVFYMEACESGSMFAHALPKNIDGFS